MSTEPPSPGTRSILVLPIGEFGWAATNQLKRLLPRVVILEGEIQNCLDTLAKNISAIAVLVSWRPMPAISDAIDARAHRAGITSCSLLLQDHEMVMGPLIVPGVSACWRCWDTRAFQADPLARIQAAKRSFYAENPESGPQGYLPSLALLGAAQLAEALGSSDVEARYAGMVLRTDLFTRQITTGRAMGLDNCGRCGLQRPLVSRSYAGLQASLQPLWSEQDKGWQ